MQSYLPTLFLVEGVRGATVGAGLGYDGVVGGLDDAGCNGAYGHVNAVLAFVHGGKGFRQVVLDVLEQEPNRLAFGRLKEHRESAS